MSQHDMNIANQGFPAFRADLNDALAALASTSTGATEPSTTFAQQLWYDSTANLLKMRNTDNDAWITLAYFDQTNDEWEIRSAVIQAVDSAGVVIKTDDGTTRLTIADDGSITTQGDLTINGDITLDDGTATHQIGFDGFNNLTLYSDQSTSEYINYKGGIGHTFRVGDTSLTNTSGSEAMRIDSSGNVGIGTTSPSSYDSAFNQLVVADASSSAGITIATPNTTYGRIAFADGTTGSEQYRGSVTYNHSDDGMRFVTAASEAMRIDSDGRLLLGKTTNDNNLTGVRLATNGSVATADQLPVLYLNRTTNDGTILEFRKDNANVGTIGVVNDSEPYFADSSSTYDAGIRLKAHGTFNMVAPCDNAGAFTDGALDFGYSGGRFRNLYLSGGVYLGGTGSANYLDDYEEGTFTAAVSGGSITSQNCTYTKIGRAVFITGEINYGGGSTDDTSFSGLPFTSANTHQPALCVYANGLEVSGSGSAAQGWVQKNSTSAVFYSFVNNGLGSLYQSGGQLRFSGVYFV